MEAKKSHNNLSFIVKFVYVVWIALFKNLISLQESENYIFKYFKNIY